MASSSSLIKYDQTPDQHFFLCRKCRTHIVLTRATIMNDTMGNVGVFEDEVVNVKVEGEDKKWEESSRSYVQVNCLGCKTILGKQMIAVQRENVIAKKGRYCLLMTKLIMWDGKKMVYAHDWEPVVEENPAPVEEKKI